MVLTFILGWRIGSDRVCECACGAQGESGEMICERRVFLTDDSTGKQESVQKAKSVLFSCIKGFACVFSRHRRNKFKQFKTIS